MSDYVKREDVRKVLGIWEWQFPDKINSIPAVDAVEVVRCKDCKYCIKQDEHEYWCNGFCQPARLVTQTDFCSHGTRCEA